MQSEIDSSGRVAGPSDGLPVLRSGSGIAGRAVTHDDGREPVPNLRLGHRGRRPGLSAARLRDRRRDHGAGSNPHSLLLWPDGRLVVVQSVGRLAGLPLVPRGDPSSNHSGSNASAWAASRQTVRRAAVRLYLARQRPSGSLSSPSLRRTLERLRSRPGSPLDTPGRTHMVSPTGMDPLRISIDRWFAVKVRAMPADPLCVA